MNESQSSPSLPPAPDSATPRTENVPATGDLDRAIERSQGYLFSVQYPEGYWVDELESNVSITVELIFFLHLMEMEDPEKVAKIKNYLLKYQQEDGGWTMFPGNPSELSYTVEAYLALKMTGLAPDRPEMVKAREYVLNNGGIRECRCFTKIFLAMMGELPWDAVPAMPVEAFLLPPGFYFNIYEMSSWSRSTVVPLMIVYTCRPVRPAGPSPLIPELFTREDRDYRTRYNGRGINWYNFFVFVDRVIKKAGKIPWKPLRRLALKRACRWLLEHQEPEGDWGGIQPPMIYSPLALKCLGYTNDSPEIVKSLEAIDRFIIDRGDHLVLQACVSPLWDSAITGNALLDSGIPGGRPELVRAAEWILQKQVTSGKGDWTIKNPHTPPGGWAFEFYNQLYPDTDDTAEILMFLHRVEVPDAGWKQKESQRALTWLLSMQSSNGGWAAFDQDNDHTLFNEVPFADHGAMLDPPTVDVTGRILWLLGILGFERSHPQVRRAIDFVKSEQEDDGCWFGRWGVNYIYGTWLALTGLCSIGEDMGQSRVRRAVDWLKARQNPDGGWGETCLTYRRPDLRGQGNSTASQTAWAVMGLLAAGEADCAETRRGIGFLVNLQNPDGSWWEEEFTGTGFPGNFYLKYHMYRQNFPLMALARYRQAKQRLKET